MLGTSIKEKDMKKLVAFTMVLLAALFWAGMTPQEVQAASASVQLTNKANTIEVGDTFTIVCQVSSEEEFNDVVATIHYSSRVIEFVKGGNKVTGKNGSIQIESTGNEDAVRRRTYSLKFRALQEGDATVRLTEAITVTNAEGTEFSISSNMLALQVGSKEPEATQRPMATPDPETGLIPTPEPEVPLNTNNKLKSLSFQCLSMSPAFNNDVSDYTVEVDCNTEKLYFNYVTANSKSKVRMKNGEDLLAGENMVKVVVTAESGDKRTFNIRVVKETESETKVREREEMGGSDITFAVYEKNGGIFIQNQYQFQVVDVEDENIIPSGYVKSSVDLDGINVPAYTMKNDLDNNYLLMYLRGVGGEPMLYQYDRQEKTLQRYTGTMIQKVNQGGNVAEEQEEIPNMWLYVALVGLMILVLALLIVILNMVLKRKIGKGKRELDDLDF